MRSELSGADQGIRSVAIVGAGAMGCLFACLAEAGVDVTLIDVDRERLDAIAASGITLDDDHGTRTVQIRAGTAESVRTAPDLLLLFTKGVHSAEALRSAAHLAGARTYGLTLQNGIGNAELLAELFTPARVLLGVTDWPSNLDGPARISSHGSGHVRLGSFHEDGTEAARAAAAMLARGGLHAAFDPDIRVAVWEKVAFNAALNPVGAVTGLPNGGLGNASGRRIARAIVAETVAVAASQGIHLDHARIEERLDFALAHHRDHRASMLQDRLAGRRSEIESINGAIVRAAAATGVPVPVTSTLADLMRLIEGGASSDGADRVG